MRAFTSSVICGLMFAATSLAQNRSQFLVTGGKSETRSELTRRCEQIRQDFREVTRSNRSWKQRITVRIHERQFSKRSVNRRAVSRVFPLPDGNYRFQLDVLLDDQFQTREFQREVVRLLLLTKMLGRGKVPEQGQAELPHWVLYGVDELIYYERTGRPSSLFGSILSTRQLLSLEDLQNMRPEELNDSISRALFQASSAAFVKGLIQQANGSIRFQAMLEDMSGEGANAISLLRLHFPFLNQPDKLLDAWWREQLASFSQTSALDLMTFAETDAKLDSLLVIYTPPSEEEDQSPEEEPSSDLWNRFFNRSAATVSPSGTKKNEKAPDFSSVRIEEFDKILTYSWAEQKLETHRSYLVQLRARAHPLYRQIIAQYEEIFAQLTQKQSRGVEERLSYLAAQREDLEVQVKLMGDHLNWYSATRVQGFSDRFNGYRDATLWLESLEQQSRKDPISLYLDAAAEELGP
ncbi:MAG: hypothetical protein AAGJ31_03915 [Verrucomicrobiota bacterium]